MHTLKTSRPYAVQTISELTARIRLLLEDSFDQIAVIGEISNAKIYNSGHWYFSLKDEDATLPCVCFKNANASIKFDLQDGLMVVARGKLSVYPPRGGYQMVVTSLEPVGIGDWQLAFEQLKEKLGKEGLLDVARKRPIPLMPRKIGVVTSASAAALADILTALKRRNRNVQVVIAPTKVQGEGSAEEIAGAINDIQKLEDIDVIIVARGGGSIEDLWSFNTEVVARAVAAAKVPVISGVGHETDVTICDLVADLRAPTPTAAAELVARGSVELVERWSNLNRLLLLTIEQRLSAARHILERLNPRRTLARQEEKLSRLALLAAGRKERLLAAVLRLLAATSHRWQQNREKLLTLGPQQTLNRGFAIVRRLDGTIIYEGSQVSPGDTLEILLRHGKLTVTVDSCQGDWLEALREQRNN